MKDYTTYNKEVFQINCIICNHPLNKKSSHQEYLCPIDDSRITIYSNSIYFQYQKLIWRISLDNKYSNNDHLSLYFNKIKIPFFYPLPFNKIKIDMLKVFL